MPYCFVRIGAKSGDTMVNTSPRRKGSANAPRPKVEKSGTPWSKGDQNKKIGLNTPLPEPLMLQLDYLVENRIIYSKASFIREIVAKAAEDAIARHSRVKEAIKRIEAEDRRK